MIKELHENPFWNNYRPNNLEEIKRNSKNNKIVRRYLRILTTIEQLVNVYIFIHTMKITKTFLNNGIYEYDYIRDHYEFFIYKSSSIFDQFLLITKDVLKLDFEDKKCNWDDNSKFKKAAHDKSKEVANFIDIYGKAQKDITIKRNINIHRNEPIDDNDFELLKLYKTYNVLNISEISNDEKVKWNVVNKHTKEKLLKQFHGDINRIVKSTCLLCDLLYKYK